MATAPDEAANSARILLNESPAESAKPATDYSNLSANEQAMRDVTIFVCSTCRKEDGSAETPTPGEKLFEATLKAHDAGNAGSSDGIKVISVECLGNCKRRLSATLVTDQAWTYVFGDLSIENGADLIEGARLMRETTNGLMPWRGRPQCLKSGMVARIPPLPIEPRSEQE